MFAASGGFADVGLRDEFVTPVIYRARLAALRLAYERSMPQGFHRLEARYSGGALESDLQPRDVREHLAMISWTRLWPLHAWPLRRAGALTFLFGGRASSMFSDTDFLDPEGFSLVEVIDESWCWSHSLDLALAVAWKTNSRQSGIALDAGLPLLRLVSRPDYSHHLSNRNGEVSENFLRAALGGRLVPVWREPAGTIGLRATRALGKRLAVEVAWQLGWWSAAEPLPLRMFSSDYLAGGRWTF